jgi:predicted transposase YbfD/YdcC
MRRGVRADASNLNPGPQTAENTHIGNLKRLGAGMGESVWECFHVVRDPRVERTRKHELHDILVISICAVICGAESWNEIEEFGRSNEDWFKTFLDLPHGIPSHDTFGRVFAALDPDEFEAAFRSWVDAVAETSAGKHISIDGKTLRRSFDTASDKAAVHMVSAWVHENHACFGQIKVDEKSNEITAIPKLLDMLCLEGATVTIDAIGCQREISQRITGKGGDYGICLKGNQGELHEDVSLFLDDAIERKSKELDTYQTLDKGHGRIERRKTWATPDVEWLRARHDWPGLQSIAAVEARVKHKGKTCVERRYFIGSFDRQCAQRFGVLARNHWSVENNLHWQLDVAFGEDDSRTRVGNAAENLSRVRRIALMLLKQEKTAKVGVKSRRKKAGWDRNYLLKVLQGN